jgi:hypothetical protein
VGVQIKEANMKKIDDLVVKDQHDQTTIIL